MNMSNSDYDPYRREIRACGLDSSYITTINTTIIIISSSSSSSIMNSMS